MIAQAARSQTIGGRPIGQQLCLPLETLDTPLPEVAMKRGRDLLF
jgi:hypothetical protein